MTTVMRELPELRKMEGSWAANFSCHPHEPVLDRAEGIYLYDEDGNRYIDASGGPMAVNVGHGDPRIAEAVAKQMARFSFCHPTLSNRPRNELCKKVASVTPDDLNTIYPVSGGSEAVESAMKLARQYHVLKGNTGKHLIISNWESYHGMTLATLAASGSSGTQAYFEPMMKKGPHIRQYSSSRRPEGLTEKQWALQCAEELELAIHYNGHRNVAAYLATPIGAGSDYADVPPPEYWQAVREICDRYDVLLIDDEVVTGFGRTGKWFGIEHFGIKADIMTMAKGISGAAVPLGAVAVSDEVNEPFAEGAHFVHGFTNNGHPVACAAGIATIDILKEDRLVENSAEVGAYLHSKRDRFLSHPTVADVRGIGLMMVLELVKDKKTMEFFDPELGADRMIQSICLKHGLVHYGTLYGAPRQPALRRGIPHFIFPPLCITRDQVDELVDSLDDALTEWETTLGLA